MTERRGTFRSYNAFSDQMERPLFGVVLCCTAVPLEQTNRFTKIVEEMGGVHTLTLTSDVTHLLIEVSHTPTTAHLTTKYFAMNRQDVRVLKPVWLEAVHQLWTTGKKINLQALEKKYKLPIFAGLSVCLTGFEDEKFQSQLECYITENGGECQRGLTKNVTHLIANSPEGRKYDYAKQWHVRVVSFLWVSDCLKRGMVLETSPYHPARSLEEQVKAALDQAKPKVQLGKRLRERDPHEDEPRKYQRTADSNPENSRSLQLKLETVELSLTLSVGDEQRD